MSTQETVSDPATAGGANASGTVGRPVLILILLAVAALAVRVWLAWRLRFEYNPDFGTVALMARHMAEGLDMPVFFYGQAYMGSLEPMISALFCRLLGFSGFAVCLGTVAIGLFLVPIVYLWGRDAMGVRAGLAAAAYLVLGPGGFLHYVVSGRGGYALTLVTGSLVLWLSIRLVRARLSGNPAGHIPHLALGLAAGVGWWTNQLVVGALLTAALLFLATDGRRPFRAVYATAGIGFLLGSLPYWVWNATHGWASFALVRSMGRTDMRTGMSLFLLERLPAVLDMTHAHPAAKAVMAAIYLAAALTIPVVVWRQLRQPGGRARGLPLATVAVFVLMSALVFSRSHFAQLDTPRYLLPLIPAVAVAVGVMTACLARRLPFGLGWVPLVLLAVGHASTLPPLLQRGDASSRIHDRALLLAAALRTERVEVVYAPYVDQSLNYLLNEEFAFVAVDRERIPLYAQRAETADRVAYLHAFRAVAEMVRDTGGDCRWMGPPDLPAVGAFARPAGGLRELPPERWASTWTSGHGPVLEIISDGRGDTCVHGGTDGNPLELNIEFDAPATVSALRIRFDGSARPATLTVEAADGTNTAWRALTRPMRPTPCFWSGPRPYWGGAYERFECRFKPATTRHLRVRCVPAGPDAPFSIAELQVFESAPALPSEAEALGALLRTLRLRGIRRLYIDRWAAAAIRRRNIDGLSTSLDPDVFETAMTAPDADLLLTPHTAIAVQVEDAPLCRRVLALRGVVLRETPVEPWVVFDVATDGWRPEYGEDLGLRWAGYACLGGDEKRWAATLAHRAEKARLGGARAEAIALLRQSLAAHADNRQRLATLVELLAEDGQSAEAERALALAPQAEGPALPCNAHFALGPVLLGVSIDAATPPAARRLRIRYFWQCPPSFATERWAVFAHFVKGNTILFQNDHVLLAGHRTRSQPFTGEVFTEDLTVDLPAGIPQGGRYELRVGLYDRRDGRTRMRVRADAPVRNAAVLLPVTIDTGAE